MDAVNRLKELTLEIKDFGEIITYTDNPADTDLRIACELFSQHLSYQLLMVNSNLCFQDTTPDVQQTTRQLYELSELITPCKVKQNNIDQNELIQWPGKLLDFCHKLENLNTISI